MNVDFSNFPDTMKSVAEGLEGHGFTITAGHGREYYLIKAEKVSDNGGKVCVDLDDENSVDMYFYVEQDEERPTHTARFRKVTKAIEPQVLAYISSFAS
jgi:hypothetical protein